MNALESPDDRFPVGRTTPGALEMMVWGVVAALGAGLAEGGLRGARLLLTGWAPVRHPALYWVAPLVHLAWLPVLALLLHWLFPARDRLTRAAVSALAVFAALLVLPILPASRVLVALGVGVVGFRAPWRAGPARRVALGLAGIVALLALLDRAVLPRWRRPPPAAAAAAGAPNILLLVLDTVRGSYLSLYGFDRATTPNLERWGRRGVVFDRAIAAAPWTLPSHASLFTGRMATGLTVGWEQPLAAESRTLAEVLQSRGYSTAGFIANTLYCNAGQGLAQGFAHYEDFQWTPADLLLTTGLGAALLNNDWLRRQADDYQLPGRKSAAQLNAAVLGWLDGPRARPFFVFANYFDAHIPVLPSAATVAAWGTEPGARPHRFRYYGYEASWRGAERFTPAERRAEREAYLAAVHGLDADVGRLLDSLEGRGLLRHTLVVITADHGEQFGRHGLFEHGNSLYPQLVQVPLLMLLPDGLGAGVRVRQVVSLRSVPATLLRLAGQEATGIPGRSLLVQDSLGQLQVRPPALVFSALVDPAGRVGASVIADRVQGIFMPRRPDEFYNLESDILAEHPLPVTADSLGVLARHARLLRTAAAGPP